MDLEFNSKEELYLRVRPALKTKVAELTRLGFKNIREEDIFNYLAFNKWINAKDLELSDIVSDIIHLKNEKIDNYVNNGSKDEVE